MVGLKGYPIIYPPDGLYYIFSKDGQFWRQHSGESEGALIDCDLLSQAKSPTSMDNRIWKITTLSYSNGKIPGPRVTLQSVQTLQQSYDTSGYVAKKNGKIVQSNKRTVWRLVGHNSKPFSYKIITDDKRLSINAPTPHFLDNKTQLLAEYHVINAYDMNVYDPQWFYFVPVDQIETFLTINEIPRSMN